MNDVPSVPSLWRARTRMSTQVFYLYIDFRLTKNTGNTENDGSKSAICGVPGIEWRVGTLGTGGLRWRIETAGR